MIRVQARPMTTAERKQPIGYYDWGDMIKYLPDHAEKTGIYNSSLHISPPGDLARPYAAVTSFTALKHAIEYGSAHNVIMPVNLEEDHTAPTEDGRWNVHVGQQKVGIFYGVWCAVDRDRNWVGCKNPYDDGILWIDEPFYRENAGVGEVLLDDFEHALAHLVYDKWTFKSNVTATLTLKTTGKPDTTGQAPVTMMLEKYRDYEVTATHGATSQVIRIARDGSVAGPASVEIDTVDHAVRFIFAPEPSIIARIMNRLFPAKGKEEVIPYV